MKIKVIDLLNKNANEEETPKEFIYRDCVFHKEGSGDYVCKESGYYITEKIAKSINLTRILNDEIEIIEEDKIIKDLKKDGTFKNGEISHQAIIDIQNKINELVKEINKLKEKK